MVALLGAGARSFGDAHAGDRFLLWGHSQGGQAALFAAHDALLYAPELKLVGVGVAASAVELGTLLRDDVSDSHALIGFTARPQVRKFFGDLLAGRTVKTTCAA